MILYYRPTCPYCIKVINAAQHLGAQLEMNDIATQPDAYAELLAKGGKSQVPFLVDTESNVAMYESDDIIAYLEKHYAAESA